MGTTSVRSRNEEFARIRVTDRVDGPPQYDWMDSLNVTDYYVVGRQKTTSQGNPWQSLKGQANPRDIGGPFETERHYFEDLSKVQLSLRKPYSVAMQYLSGPGYVDALGTSVKNRASLPRKPYISDVDLLALGSTAISQTLPTDPGVSVTTAFAELLRDGLPSYVGASILSLNPNKGPAERLSSEVLNSQFGIQPLVSDLTKLAQRVVKSNDLIRQMERDSGRLVRRRYAFPKVIETSTKVTEGVYPLGFPGSWFQSAGTLTTEVRHERRAWFAGGYTYFYNPELKGKFEGNMVHAKTVLGHQITLDGLWQLAPWSWLVDWKTNVGDVMKNLTYIGRDGLVLKYGYIMGLDIHRETHTLSGLKGPQGQPLPAIVQRHTFVHKRRLQATPYGFGLDPGAFSAKQWAILASLGFTKGGWRL